VKAPVVANPTEPVPCKVRAKLAVAAVPDKEPVTVMFTAMVASPVTVREPVMYGELSIILFIL
jgi:hypothetical protein